MTSNNEIKCSIPANSNAPEMIERIEQRLQVKIPPSLKKLLLLYDSIKLEKTTITYLVNERAVQQTLFTEIFGAEEIFKSLDNLEDAPDFSYIELLVFGETLGSTMVCVGISPQNYNQIFMFDYDFLLTKVNKSFEGFINSLELYEAKSHK